jgi:hypothetical protein
MTLALTGAQVEEKARFAAEAVWASIPGGRSSFAETAEDLSGELAGSGMAYLRLAVRGDDERSVGRAFSGAVVETSLSSYPGTFFTSAPSGAQGVARYWPTTVARTAVAPRVLCDGREVRTTVPTAVSAEAPVPLLTATAVPSGGEDGGESRRQVRVPLHVLIGARSGDKGGDANIGVWADDDRVAAWLERSLTTELLVTLLPEVAPFEVSRYSLPNLHAVNFVVHSILGWGVASNLRLDTQAKGLGELLRSRYAEVPAYLVSSGRPAVRWAAYTASASRPI